MSCAEIEDQHTFADISSLVLRLALQLQDVTLKKDEVDLQIQIFQEIVAKKKSEIENTRKSIENLEKDLSDRQKLLMHYKDSMRSLRETNRLLLQYEEMLQQELRRTQESCNQDTKMYEERTENYRKVFEEHKEQYCQSPLAQKLIKIQQEKAEIEQRILACEDKIISKGKELQALQGPGPQSPFSENVPTSEQQNPAALQHPTAEESAPGGSIMAEGEVGIRSKGEEVRNVEVSLCAEEDQHKDTENESAAPLSSVDMWNGRDNSGVFIHSAGVLDEGQMETAQEGDSETAEEQQKDTAGQELQSHSCSKGHTEDTGGYPLTPPPRMKAVSDTPTFSLSGSPCPSLDCYDVSESFVFSAPSAPDTPGFSGFEFSTELAQEDKPFSFSASCFNHKKTSGPKAAGFLFEQMDSCPDQEFSFSFSKSPGERAAGPGQEGLGDTNPFSFSFGKFQ
ncbi:protein SIX6OS1 isoform X2 [Scleropages formosus]|uniref:protein SIX6OS1 isoform X2 n=1 Tax=Scleropages formosus TaxID=113540 RepID=UPI0010FA79B1|nr:protein SIX6OS1 isoform X2 [Scleropages formosus]